MELWYCGGGSDGNCVAVTITGVPVTIGAALVDVTTTEDPGGTAATCGDSPLGGGAPAGWLTVTTCVDG